MTYRGFPHFQQRHHTTVTHDTFKMDKKTWKKIKKKIWTCKQCNGILKVTAMAYRDQGCLAFYNCPCGEYHMNHDELMEKYYNERRKSK